VGLPSEPSSRELCPWLSEDPPSGIVPPDDSQEVEICVDAGDLLPGEYLCDLIIDSNDPDEPQVTIPVSMVVLAPPDIDVLPPSMSFALVPEGSECDTLFISNAGEIELTWSIEDTCAWLDATPSSGVTAPEGTDHVIVCADAVGLALGVYDCNLTVTSDDPDEPVVVVPVTLTVAEPPNIQVTPDSFSFTVPDSGSACDTLFVSNTGQLDLSWSIADTCGWLTHAPSGGVVSSDSTAVVAVCVDAAAAPPGEYQCELVVNSNDPDEPQIIVPVSMSVVTTGVDDGATVPRSYALRGNFPNPFNPFTTIRYDLPRPMRVSLSVYDISGRLVRTLLDNVEQDAGFHAIPWNSRDDHGHPVVSGVYMCRLEADGSTLTGQMVLVK
jgi:hypothetical protein